MYLVTFQNQEQKKYTSAVKAVKACEEFFQCLTKEGLTEIKKSLRNTGLKTVHHCMTDDVSCFIEKAPAAVYKYLVTFQGQDQQKYINAAKAIKACEEFFQCQTKEGLTEIKKSLRSIGWKRVHHCMTDNVICFIEKI